MASTRRGWGDSAGRASQDSLLPCLARERGETGITAREGVSSLRREVHAPQQFLEGRVGGQATDHFCPVGTRRFSSTNQLSPMLICKASSYFATRNNNSRRRKTGVILRR